MCLLGFERPTLGLLGALSAPTQLPARESADQNNVRNEELLKVVMAHQLTLFIVGSEVPSSKGIVVNMEDSWEFG